jgi:hypothetical protein
MPQTARECTCALFQETTFGEGPTNWDADAAVREFLPIDPDWSELREGVVENRNARRRAFAPYPKLPALRNGTFKFGIYAAGRATTVAAGVQSTTDAHSIMLRNAWGGLRLGYATGVVDDSTTAPEVTAAAGANYPAGSAFFAVDAAGSGQFALVGSVAGDVLTLRTALDNAPASIGAAVALFPHTRALTNRAHASHTTLSLYFRGEHTEDSAIGLGCKLNVTGLENTQAGGDASWAIEGMARDFQTETADRAALTGVPEGPTGPIVGRAGTAVRIANVGTAALVDVGAYTFAFTPGIANAPVPGMGEQGRLGYHSPGTEDTTLTVTVPYDAAWIEDFRAGQHKHVMVQVGDQPGDAYAIYLPNAEIAEDPKRGADADETSMTLVFRAREFAGATHTEGTDNYEMERARFQVWRAA